MKDYTRYRCTYCGTDDIVETLPPWKVPDKRCKKCNHDKFKAKIIEGQEVDYYDEKEPEFPWSE